MIKKKPPFILQLDYEAADALIKEVLRDVIKTNKKPISKQPDDIADAKDTVAAAKYLLDYFGG